MKQGHDTSKVLDQEDIRYLNSYFMSFLNTPRMDTYSVNYNLCNVKFLVPPTKDVNIHKCVDKLKRYSRDFLLKLNIKEDQGEGYKCFFLEYYQGSFTQLHTDNLLEAGTSLITLIDCPNHTEGGDIIIEESVLITDGKIKTTDKSATEVSLRSIECIKQNIGDTSIYRSGIKHGVSKLTRGRRRVFVCWLGSAN